MKTFKFINIQPIVLAQIISTANPAEDDFGLNNYSKDGGFTAGIICVSTLLPRLKIPNNYTF